MPGVPRPESDVPERSDLDDSGRLCQQRRKLTAGNKLPLSSHIRQPHRRLHARCQSESMGAFIVQESTSGSSAQGSLSGATFTRFVPDGVKSTQLVSSPRTTTCSPSRRVQHPRSRYRPKLGAERKRKLCNQQRGGHEQPVDLWRRFQPERLIHPVRSQQHHAGGHDSDGAAANNDKDVFVLAISGSGVISQVANGTATVASVDTSPRSAWSCKRSTRP